MSLDEASEVRNRVKAKSRQESIMSWQAYVDDQLVGTGMVNKACIIGLNGGVWAQSHGFAVCRCFLSVLT